jgi:hypothetical protein
MLLLLLRLLTAPTPALPAGAVVEEAARPQPTIDATTLRNAQADLATIEAGPTRIRALMRAAGNRPVYQACVGQRLAEAQVHVSLGRDEMQLLTDPPSAPDDRAHARRRLGLLAQRTRELELAARSCVDEEDSTISATKFHTDVPAKIERRGDVTSPPPLPRPCPGSECIVLPEP